VATIHHHDGKASTPRMTFAFLSMRSLCRGSFVETHLSMDNSDSLNDVIDHAKPLDAGVDMAKSPDVVNIIDTLL
jgi:hypothetical protein